MKIKKILLILLLLSMLPLAHASAQQARTFFKKVERTRQKINFARDIQLTANNPEAGRLIRMADANLRRAVAAAKKRRRLGAVRNLRKAEEAVNSALKILFRENIENRRRRLEKLIKDAEQLVQTRDNEEAKKFFGDGLKNKGLAIKFLRENNFRKALFHYNKAVFLLKKSITVARNEDKSTAQVAEDEAYRYSQFYEKNKKELLDSTHPGVKKNVDLAQKIAQKADRARQDGKSQEAIDFYHQATRLLSRALNIASGKENKMESRADEEVALLDELVENLEKQMPPETRDEMSEFLISQIQLLQENAHIFLKEQKSDEAIRNANMARNLAERLLKKRRIPE